MCAEFKKAEEKVKKPFVKLKAQGKWKSVGLNRHKTLGIILDAAVLPPTE
jgi:hypothetical protein